jgi:hypothetical protein
MTYIPVKDFAKNMFGSASSSSKSCYLSDSVQTKVPNLHVYCCHFRHRALSFCCIIESFENAILIASVVILTVITCVYRMSTLKLTIWQPSTPDFLWTKGNWNKGDFADTFDLQLLSYTIWATTSPTPQTLCCVLLVLILHNGIMGVDDLLTTMQQLELIITCFTYMAL